METDVQRNNDIVPAHLAVQAMRDNGYKNAAYAIAELVDNSIQAGATQVELLCGERVEQLAQRQRLRINKIAVLDNGSGMNADVLRMALQFGNGTHLTPDAQDGIGKFGMGLPSASISQCRRVDVWSWQDGPDSALYTYIDLDEIKSRKQEDIPEPRREPIPSLWRQVGQEFGESGTLVVWSRLDRVMWKTARAIIDNSELLIGRMYRKFLHEGKVRILFHPFDLDDPQQEVGDLREALPNDPLYLMPKTSCPKPFDTEPMFYMWGDEPHVEKIRFRGEVHEVTVTISVAKEKARSESEWGRNPGSHPHGQHARKNIGVSIVRAGRELELDATWTSGYDPVDRWWGVEVAFPPALDDLFGVSNNKQYARNLHKIDEDSLLLDGESPAQLHERLQREEDPVYPILRLSKYIERSLSVLRQHLSTQKRNERKRQQRHSVDVDEKHATEETKKRQQEGYHGGSDEEETRPADQRQQEIGAELAQQGLSTSAAEELAAQVVLEGLKYKIVESSLETAAFFSVKPKAGTLIVTLNTAHPAYHHLVEVLDENTEDAEEQELRDRLRNARSGLRLLLMAWARYEDELSGERRHRAQEVRFDWGRIARQFLDRND